MPPSLPRVLLHLEGAAVLVAAVWAYAHVGFGWGWFALLFLAPDVAMLGYLAGPRAGAAAYNAVHTYVGPLALAGLAAADVVGMGLGVAAVWAAHIGVDRLLGYGLKYASGFRDTHLARA